MSNDLRNENNTKISRSTLSRRLCEVVLNGSVDVKKTFMSKKNKLTDWRLPKSKKKVK